MEKLVNFINIFIDLINTEIYTKLLNCKTNSSSFVLQIKYCSNSQESIEFDNNLLNKVKGIGGIYGFKVMNPEYSVLFYIGKASDLKSRLIQHLTIKKSNGQNKNQSNKNKFNDLLEVLKNYSKKEGYSFTIQIITYKSSFFEVVNSFLETILINYNVKCFEDTKEMMKLEFNNFNQRKT